MHAIVLTRFLLAALLALSAFAAHAGSGGLPDRLVTVWALSRGTLEIARVEEQYERHGDRYTLVSEARAVGVAALLARGQGWRRESEGSIAPDGLRPISYSDQRGSNPLQRAQFDWLAGQIRFERVPQPGTGEALAAEVEPLPAGTTDRLSFPYSLAQGARPPAGDWEVVMTDGRRLTRYRFALLGRETVRVPAGSFEALRVSRVREKNETGTDIWLALDRNLLPVRILVTEPDGTTFDQVLLQAGP